MDFSDRVVVISGATGGLGRFATQQFARAGARLVLVSSNEDNLRSLADELALSDDGCLIAAANLLDPQAAQQVVEESLSKFGRADILLHLVGGWVGGKPLIETGADEIEQMLNQHVWTTYYLAHAFVAPMSAQNWGRIIVVSSPNASIPRAKSAAYSAAKAAQESLILTVAQEVKGTGVTANVIRVNAIDVERQRLSNPSRENASWSTPEEICAAVFYLCSQDAALVNGARIPLYGSP